MTLNYRKLSFLLILLPILTFAQHTIKATFSPAKDFTWAILYKNEPTNIKYIAQAKVENGTAIFNLDEKATPGVYKLVYAVPQKDNNFDIIYNGEEDIELTFSTNDSAVFQKSTDNILLNSYLTEALKLGEELETAYTKPRISSSEVISIYKKQEELQITYEGKSQGKIVQNFIKANKPYIPKNYEAPKVYVSNLTTNYFTNIDFNSSVLQSSNFLIEKSLAYILGVDSEPSNKQNSYNKNIDTIAVKVKKSDPKFQISFLDKLWEKLVSYSLIETSNYLAEMYLIPLATQQNDPRLVAKLNKFKNLSIGNVAPDFSWDTIENGVSKTYKLSELAVSENYILVFWSSTCSHCLKQIPQLQQFVKTLNSSKYKVVAVGLEDEPINWQREIKKYPEFIHAIKLKKWDSNVVREYALTSTPTYFVLDKDKKFIDKPEGFEELLSYLEKNK